MSAQDSRLEELVPMMWHDDGWGVGWWWVVMPVMMIGFWVLVAWVVVSVLRRPPRSEVPMGSDADRILGERFARGEIDEDEYRRRLAVLHAQPGPR